jgi:uncharacterized protein (DUF2249 family)
MVASTDTDGETDSESDEGDVGNDEGDAGNDDAGEQRTLDAREIDGEPFGAIVGALEDLPAGGTLCLVNSFEPAPLYDVLDRRGFDHETEQVAEDEWHVSITHA